MGNKLGNNEKDMEAAIQSVRKAGPKVVALSPHDSCDWSLDQFRQAFGDAYVDLKVGREIRI